MSINYDALVSALTGIKSNASLSVDARRSAVELAIARAVAYHLPIPSDSNIESESYFTNKLQKVAKKALSKINEVFPFDIQRSYALIYRVWSVRYALVHEPSSLEASTLFTNLISSDKFLGEQYAEAISGEGLVEVQMGMNRVSNTFSGCLLADFFPEV